MEHCGFSHRKLHIPTSASNQPISRRNIKQFIAFACTAWVNLLSNDEIQGLENCIFANCVPATARIQVSSFVNHLSHLYEPASWHFSVSFLISFPLFNYGRYISAWGYVTISRLRHFKANACFIHLLLFNLVLMQTYVTASWCGRCRYPHFSVALLGLSMFVNVEALKMFSPQKPQSKCNK